MKASELGSNEMGGLIRSPGILKKTEMPETVPTAGDSFKKTGAYAEDPTKNFRERLRNIAEAALKDLAPMDVNADAKAFPIGAASHWTYEILGSRILVHEKGHQIVDQLLWNNNNGYVQVDGHENIRNLVQNPTTGTFANFLTGYDADQNHYGGYYASTSKGDLSPLGARLTDNQRGALVSASGSIIESIPSVAAFLSGFKLRKKHPLLGYSLMTFGTLGYLRASVYPITAIFPEVRALAGGHDWTSVYNLTGINPVLSAAAFVSGLPLLALALYAAEKLGESKVKDRIALSNLLANGKISPEEIGSALEEYKGKAPLTEAEERLMAVIATPLAKADKRFVKDFSSALKTTEKEYGKFSDYLIGKFKDRVKAEKADLEKQIPKMSLLQAAGDAGASLKLTWKHDKAGAILMGSSGAISGSVLALSLFRIIPELIIQSRGITPQNMYGVFNLLSQTSASLQKVLSAAVPAAGLTSVACSYYLAGQVLQSKSADWIDKGAAVISAVSSGVTAAGIFIPGAGVPLMLVGIAGQIGAWVGKKICRKLVE